MTNPALAGDVQTAFGAWLRRQREERGIPVGEIADLTRLPAGRIEALEGGRWDVFGAVAYVRGAVRAYAVAIGLDPDATLLKLEADGLGEGAAQPWSGLTDPGNPLFRSEGRRPPVRAGRILGVTAALAGVAALVAGIVHLYGLPVEPRMAPALPPEFQQAAAGSPSAPPPEEAPAEATVEPPEPPALHRLQIRATDSAWFKIVADGGEPREWTLPAGRTMAVEATASIDFLTGNAGGLVLRVDEGPEFSPGVSGEVRRRVFRFPAP